MAIIIGSNTIIGGSSFPSGGIVSIQWGIQPQVSRLWQLGAWAPYKTLVTRVTSLSITTYAGAGPSINLQPAAGCTPSRATINVTISPGSCGAIPPGLGGSFTVYLSSYSYNKGDAIGFGQQSYAGQNWPGPEEVAGDIIYNGAPSVVLQGTAEGTETSDTGLITGVTFSAGDFNVYGQEGSVSAGFPGIGQADTVHYGLVSAISNGSLRASGKVGQASVTIPHQPLYY